jgi:hypothetical protein
MEPLFLSRFALGFGIAMFVACAPSADLSVQDEALATLCGASFHCNGADAGVAPMTYQSKKVGAFCVVDNLTLEPGGTVAEDTQLAWSVAGTELSFCKGSACFQCGTTRDAGLGDVRDAGSADSGAPSNTRPDAALSDSGSSTADSSSSAYDAGRIDSGSTDTSSSRDAGSRDASRTR